VPTVRRGEIANVLLSAAYLFALLAALYVLRPVRDAMGIAGGVRNLPWLFTATLVATFLANPLFGAAVTWLPRRRFLPLVHHVSAVSLLGFAGALAWLPESQSVDAGRAFYVFMAVHGLFSIAVFWGFMADLWTHEQGKRLFGLVAAGGTSGAMAGSFVTARIAERTGPAPLLVGAAVLLEVAVLCVVVLLARSRDPRAAGDAAALPDASEGGVLEGLRLVARSRYLQTIAVYLFLFTTTSTVLYLQQARIVEASADDAGGWTAIFADIDFYANVVALGFQGLVTPRLLARFGVAAALALLPAWTALAFAGLAIWPVLPMLVVAQVMRRGMDYGLAKPAREVLYTVVGRETKYKAKSFIDTFVYRGGDAAAAWGFERLAAAGVAVAALAWASVPIALVWLGLGVVLGRGDAARAREL
jgi:AAA family ATP:ADP antiporter